MEGEGGGGGGGGGGDGDRLSSLPEHIIHHIFSFLDTIAVVKATAVSRKLRYFLVSMPYLNFESNGYFDSQSKIKFNDFVNWVLMSRNRSVDIQRFRISYFYLNENYAFYRLMHVITGCNLQELDLMIRSKDEIELPRCILNCRSLVSLKLSFDHYSLGTFPGLKNCIFPGFIRLKSLELCFVMFMDSLSLANFVSSCPYLENLSVHECTFVDDNIIEITATSLKDLSIILPPGQKWYKERIRTEQIRNYGLKIACPNLVSLKVVNLRSRKFSFQETNSLQNLFMDLHRQYDNLKVEQCCQALCKMLKGVCNVKALKVSEVFLEYLLLAVDIPESFSPLFNNLKSLTLGIRRTDFNKHSLINMLECSPNLETLNIFLKLSIFRTDFPFMPKDPWKMPNMPNGTTSCLKYHLKIVELFHVRDDKYELDLVKFFLKYGHILQKMRISWVHGHGNTDEIISEIMKFPRSSPNVALTFVEPNDISLNGKSYGCYCYA
ncbi:hypothetical protein Dsin_022971 [Dipteronia sinensis]|uniref:F-box domain-containing protein n=1 Tax=Dipteronia sinensis TaxID=43782 RepID=A0AAE0E0F3_9ROSI|nr:hypothetical protein Dsin_022971 [Dipteronia sinensis]